MSLYPIDFLVYQVAEGDIERAKWVEENVTLPEAMLWLGVRHVLYELAQED